MSNYLWGPVRIRRPVLVSISKRAMIVLHYGAENGHRLDGGVPLDWHSQAATGQTLIGLLPRERREETNV